MSAGDDKETKPLNGGEKRDSSAGVGGSVPVRNVSHERRLYRSGSLSLSAAQLHGSSAIALGSFHSIGSKGNMSMRSRTSSGKSIRSTQTTRAAYHEDLKQDLKRGYNRNIVFMSFIILMGTSFEFGYNIGVMNQPSQLIQHFYNKTYTERQSEVVIITDENGTVSEVTVPGDIDEYTVTFLWSVTNTMYVIGGMIGAFTAGFVANKFGRKKAVLIACIPAFIGAILCAICQLAKAPELLMIGRLITGINCGMGTQLAPMYLLEIAPYNLKGAFGTACQLFCTIGIFMSAVFGLRELLGVQPMWPVLFLLNALPALLCCIVLPFLPESPRYLMLIRNDRKAAEDALKFIRRNNEVSTDMEEMETELQGTGANATEEKASLKGDAEATKPEEETYTMKMLLLTRQLRMPLFIAMFLQVIQQLSGINAIFFYSNSIYTGAGVAAYAIQYAVLLTNAINVIMTIVAVPVMDKAGRRPLLLFPMIAMVLILALITIALKLQSTLVWMSYVSIGCVLLYVICFAVGLGPIPGMIGAEMFRQGPRPYAMSLAGLTNWLFTAIVAISFELIQKVTKEYTFLIFLILMIGFTVFVFFLVPETKNKTFEEIASKWQEGGEIEVEEVVPDHEYTEEELANITRNGGGDEDEANGGWSLGAVGDVRHSDDVFIDTGDKEKGDAGPR